MTIVERLYEVWNRHAVAGILEFFTEGLEYRDQALGLAFSGKDELGAFVAATFVAMPDLNFEVTRAFENDRHFAAEAIMRGTQEHDLPGIPARHKPFTVNYAIFGDLRGGKITRIVDYWNLAEFTGGDG